MLPQFFDKVKNLLANNHSTEEYKVKIKKITYLIGLAAALLMAGCTDDDLAASNGQGGSGGITDGPAGTPVLFTVGNLNLSKTRADVIPYMAQGGRFVCTMYYHPGASDTDESNFDILHPDSSGTMTTAWLQVNNTVGNSVYRKNTFAMPTNTDTYDFDRDATNFYWQNRLNHAFLALTDYNKLSTNDGSTTVQGKLKMYPHHDKDMVTLPASGATHEDSVTYANILADNRYVNTYDLIRTTSMDTIADQPDPILALTVMKPGGATQEANRVKLYFKHQFSQIQVNLKAADDQSASLTSSQIDKVELLGVTEKGYVNCRLNAAGTVGPARYEAVDLESYTDAQIDANPYGTSFEMFDMVRTSYAVDEDQNGIDDRYADGYLKSFNAIAYGYLRAIRITWHEAATTVGGNHIEHIATYEVPLTTGAPDNIPLQELESGRKYIYNLELRRGTLAVIRTQIVDWEQDEKLVYGTDGTITN